MKNLLIHRLQVSQLTQQRGKAPLQPLLALQAALGPHPPACSQILLHRGRLDPHPLLSIRHLAGQVVNAGLQLEQTSINLVYAHRRLPVSAEFIHHSGGGEGEAGKAAGLTESGENELPTIELWIRNYLFLK